jgi:chloride channel 3/4/5
MVAAGATMCGVTRLSVTLAVILFELTGSLDHVLPFSVGILVSKWTADFIEPKSIYDLLTDMNAYPFLDNKHRPAFTSQLAELMPRSGPRKERLIDVSASPLVPATDLREKLNDLHEAGELDGGLPIVRDGVLVGLIAGPHLEFALDGLENEENSLCLVARDANFNDADEPEEEEPLNERSSLLTRSRRILGRRSTGFSATTAGPDSDPTDFTQFVDPSPVALDEHSPMDLVYECFVKLGLRYMCVLRDGRFLGMLHKKAFVRYCKDMEEKDHLS